MPSRKMITRQTLQELIGRGPASVVDGRPGTGAVLAGTRTGKVIACAQKQDQASPPLLISGLPETGTWSTLKRT